LKDIIGNTFIKWPNDIYIGKGKVAGILIENCVRINKISSSIVGIGLNVNQQFFTSDAPNPVSLSQITGEVYDLEESFYHLCLKIDARYHQLRSGEFGKIDGDYIDFLFQQGYWSNYSDENGDFEGKILGVDLFGRLKVETRTGKIKKFNSKEIVFK